MTLKLVFAGIGVLAGLAGAALWLGTREPAIPSAAPEVTPSAILSAHFTDATGQSRAIGQFQGRVVVLQQRPAPKAVKTAAPASPASPPPSIVLIAGQQLVAGLTATPVVAPVSLNRATAWEAGQLVFQDEPLAGVAERVSRYAEHPIAVDPGVGGLRISGKTPDGKFVEIAEIPEHPWYLAVQFHPEFKSKPLQPHPLFAGFVGASIANRRARAGSAETATATR